MSSVITVLDVVDQCNEGETPVPSNIYHIGWGRNLLLGGVVFLYYLCYMATQKIPLNQGIEKFRSMHPDHEVIFDFSYSYPEMDKEEYEFNKKNAERMKESYEKSGYFYPKTLEDLADLFVKLGLAIESEIEGEKAIIPILSPLPKPQDILKLDDNELKIVKAMQENRLDELIEEEIGEPSRE